MWDTSQLLPDYFEDLEFSDPRTHPLTHSLTRPPIHSLRHMFISHETSQICNEFPQACLIWARCYQIQSPMSCSQLAFVQQRNTPRREPALTQFLVAQLLFQSVFAVLPSLKMHCICTSYKPDPAHIESTGLQ